MRKKFLSIILAAVLSFTICIPSLAASPSSIPFINNLETIELVFSDTAAKESVSEIIKDGSVVSIYELTVLPDSTITEILPPMAAGRYSISVEDALGAALTFDGGTFTEDELESLIYTYLMQRENIMNQITLAILAGINTIFLEALLKETDDNITYYMMLRDNLKKALTIKTISPSNTDNTTVSRETTYKLIKQGTYTLWFKPEGAPVPTMAIKLNITYDTPVPSSPQPEPEPESNPDSAPLPPITALPTPSTVFVNGVKTDFDAYNINGNNFFKLRDLAFVLNGTIKQFEVTWDGQTSTIGLISGLPYTPVGGEMSAKASQTKTPQPTSAAILLDGVPVSFTAYIIDGNNYFKLRDIGNTFDFNVSFNAADSSVIINTAESYSAD